MLKSVKLGLMVQVPQIIGKRRPPEGDIPAAAPSLPDLPRLANDDLRRSAIEPDSARHANSLALKARFRRAELGSIVAPDHCGEGLARVGLVEIEERRLAPTPGRIVRRRHDAANGGVLAYMTSRVLRAEGLRVRGDGHQHLDEQDD